jgi:hypothetical protein
MSCRVKVKVTLRLTVGRLGVEPNLGLLTRDFFFLSKLQSCLCGAPSLTRSRVCHLSVFVNTVYSSQSIFTFCVTHISAIYSIYRPRSVLCTADYALLTSSLLYYGSLKH